MNKEYEYSEVTMAEDDFYDVKLMAKTKGITLENLDPAFLRDLYPEQRDIVSVENGKITYKDGSVILFDGESVRLFSEFIFVLVPESSAIHKYRCVEISKSEREESAGIATAMTECGQRFYRHSFEYNEQDALYAANSRRDDQIEYYAEQIERLKKKSFYVEEFK